MLCIVRRTCFLVALLFWQGGFMFYGAVVVPVGAGVLGSDEMQGFITRSVTNSLNVAGLVALGMWWWDMVSVRDGSSSRGWLRWAAWVVLVVTLGLLFWLHVLLDRCLDVEAQQVLDRAQYRFLHRWYLSISTVQWVISMVLMVVTLIAWRAEEHRRV